METRAPDHQISTDVQSIADMRPFQHRPQRRIANESEPTRYAEDSSEPFEYVKHERLKYYRIPSATKPNARFTVLQKWEGVVLEVTAEQILARLKGLQGAPTEMEAEIPIEEMPPDEREFLMRGAIFYWSVGYRDKPSGSRERVSQIRFRRFPEWSREELDAAREEADEMHAFLTAGD